MGKREENRRKTEEQIYESALDLFCEEGYESARLTDIAYSANVSTRTLYNYFPTKESILRKFGEDTIESTAEFAKEIPVRRDPMEKILDICVYDYMEMFGLFDMSMIIYGTGDGGRGYVSKSFRMSEETIYEALLESFGMDKEGSYPATRDATTVVFAIYRHVTDKLRVENPKCFDATVIRDCYRRYLSVVWDSVLRNVESEA